MAPVRQTPDGNIFARQEVSRGCSGQRLQGRASRPRNAAAAARIEAAHSEWHILSVNRDSEDVGHGFWVTVEKRSLTYLVERLFSGHASQDDWHGAVCCTIQDEPPLVLNDGQHHIRVGPLLIYGDLEMLRAIADPLRR
ncbi:MAG TPA: hypothetical protein VH682_03440 [Gemmataceae bacterium]